MSMVNKMVLARTPAPNLEEKLNEFLNSDKVSSIDFVLRTRKTRLSRTTFKSDDEFYVRMAGRLGSYVTIFVAADSEISADTAAETKVGGSIYRRQINVRSGVLDRIETQETLVHEMTNAGLVYDLLKLCHEPVPESGEDLYWALGEVICYVAGASFLLTNGASYGPGDPVCTKAYEMAKKAQSEKDHILHPKDIRELVAILRKDPVYKKNLGVRNTYWDTCPKAAENSKHH
jgi:hypothetical protein